MPRVKYIGFTSKRPFGVELETGCEITKAQIKHIIEDLDDEREIRVTEWDQTIDNNWWHVKQDSTCGPAAHLKSKDYGWEVASYKASGYKDIKKICEVAEALSRAGLTVNRNCGLHIHAEAKDFTPAQAAIFLAYWMKAEWIMSFLVDQSRLKNKHCKLWTRFKKLPMLTKFTPEIFWSHCCPTNFAPHSNAQKKVTLNFVNFAAACDRERRGHDSYRKTIELRWPEGTLSKESIGMWVRLYLHMVDGAKKLIMPDNLMPMKTVDEFMRFLNLESKDEFYLLGSSLRNLKHWILTKIVKNTENKPGRKLYLLNKEAREKLENSFASNLAEEVCEADPDLCEMDSDWE